MDKPTTPAGPNASPWPEESGSEQDFGATGVFGTVKAPEPVDGPAGSWREEPDAQGNRATEVAKPQPAPQPVPAPKVLSEPVVHKVVFGGGAAESSPELLDRMRMASAERVAAPEKAPADEPGGRSAAASSDPSAGGQGSAGFTELLRTLGSDLPSPAVAAAPVPAPETRRPIQESGLTSLLQSLGPPPASAPPEEPIKRIQPAAPSIAEEPRRAPAAPGTGGFTELLQTMPGGGSEFGGPQTPARTQPAGLGEAPIAGGTPAPLENKPGTFTQLFGTLGGAEASPPAPLERGTGESTHGGAGSFTRMLSLEQQSAPAAPSFHEESRPSAGSLDYGHTPQAAEPARTSRDPFSSSPLPETQPVPSTPPGSGAGITRLIQMLDQPSSAPAPRMEDAPVSVPPGTGPGIWTQTFASLSTPNEPAAPAAKTPEWTPPPAPPLAPGPAVARDAHFSSSQIEPAVSASAAAGSTAGPSEFTRILDASRIRELAMKGSPAPPVANPPPPPQSFAPPPPLPIPNYPVPVPPYAGGVPHPGVYPPPLPQMPNYPMNYAPHAGAMPTPGGSLPQPPGMYIPAPPMPAVPPAPALKPAEPGMGKLQQYVPLLLILTIVLLVVLLVTIIFVMKH